MALDFRSGEVLLINKPLKWTSFDVVGRIRVLLKYKLSIPKIKVGHAGTLDPLATGLLIVCTGLATKSIESFQGLPKVYTGTFVLGSVTASYDLETLPVQRGPYQQLAEQEILRAAASLTGSQLQVPPDFSAIRQGGKRAYESARQGIGLRLDPRPVTITRFEIKAIRLPEIDFEVECSKGTYIRALARDFGEKLGCGAYLSALCRTLIGSYSLNDAMSPEQLELWLDALKNESSE